MEARYSVVVPVYNRPEEVDELLQSLTEQTYKDFEVIIVEDGSKRDSRSICERYGEQLDLKYFAKENEGPGLARNYGFQKAGTDFFVIFDSDCLIPPEYFENLDNYRKERFDAYGGPDAAHSKFGMLQKAVNHAMTSFLTTGGIRGKSSSVEKFKPRSFNMGISREVFQKTGGFSSMRYGEDIDFSLRIEEEGLKTVLLEDCFVYHKRRTNLAGFYRQVKESGKARIELRDRHPGSLKLVHHFPAAYSLFLLLSLVVAIAKMQWLFMAPVFLYWVLIFLEALFRTFNPITALLSVITSNLMLIGYGYGFIKNWFFRA